MEIKRPHPITKPKPNTLTYLSSFILLPTGKTPSRNSINTKIFGEEREEFTDYHSHPQRENRRNAGLGYVDVLTTPAHVEKQYNGSCTFEGFSFILPPTGKTPNRDSINAKVFGEEREEFTD